jgi:hypothetical protein
MKNDLTVAEITKRFEKEVLRVHGEAVEGPTLKGRLSAHEREAELREIAKRVGLDLSI